VVGGVHASATSASVMPLARLTSRIAVIIRLPPKKLITLMVFAFLQECPHGKGDSSRTYYEQK
jgi:hypothetical protein